jgi:hypothetical protein
MSRRRTGAVLVLLAAAGVVAGVVIMLFAAGYVQISGAGIYPGLEVTDSQG